MNEMMPVEPVAPLDLNKEVLASVAQFSSQLNGLSYPQKSWLLITVSYIFSITRSFVFSVSKWVTLGYVE